MTPALEDKVRDRAQQCCEYCQMPQEFVPQRHQIDHIRAKSHKGGDESTNLALACLSCNLHKGTNLSGIDPVTNRITRLFHPRRDHWAEHFQWDGAFLHGRTAVGRATVETLHINDAQAVLLRHELLEDDAFPPDRLS